MLNKIKGEGEQSTTKNVIDKFDFIFVCHI